MPFSASNFRDSSARLFCESPSDVEQPTRPYDSLSILDTPYSFELEMPCTSVPQETSNLKPALLLCHFGSSYRARECMRMDEMIGSAGRKEHRFLSRR